MHDFLYGAVVHLLGIGIVMFSKISKKNTQRHILANPPCCLFKNECLKVEGRYSKISPGARPDMGLSGLLPAKAEPSN